jgi:hypothetical protein
MPKCAGTSVRTLLENSHGDRLVEDYDSFFKIPQPHRNELILNALLSPIRAPSDKIVYGHFFPVKYIGSETKAAVNLVTILRDPIARLHSHYHFWNSGDFSDHYLWRKMKSEQWDFTKFAFSAEMRNFYSQYITHVPLGLFTYIGLYENLEVSVAECFAALGGSSENRLKVPRHNVTPVKEAIPLDGEVVARLREYHAEDYLIYEFARRKFDHKLHEVVVG